MSTQRSNIAAGLFEALARWNVQRAVERCSADFVLVPLSTEIAEREPYHGHDGLRRYLDDLRESWTEFRVSVHEYREAGDAIVALGRIYARAPDFLADGEAGFVLEFDGELISVCRVYPSHREALAAATARK